MYHGSILKIGFAKLSYD